MRVGFFKNPKTKERRNKPLPCSPTGEKAEKYPQSGSENLMAVSAVLSSLMENPSHLTMKFLFHLPLMLKVSGFHPDDLKNHSFCLKYQLPVRKVSLKACRLAGFKEKYKINPASC